MRFKYLTDPLFLICLGLFAVNRWILEPTVGPGFFTSYLNDLICIPFCVPPMLFLLRTLRLRADEPPQVYEIIIPLLVWSIAFEIWLPALPIFQGLATADPVDILCYTAGALLAGCWWNQVYAPNLSNEEGCRFS